MATTKKMVKKLISEGWIMTDPSCNQMCKEIVEDEIYLFREDRIINPETGETEVYESEMNINYYSWGEKIDACNAFGYSDTTVDKWITEGEETQLILECLFELQN